MSVVSSHSAALWGRTVHFAWCWIAFLFSFVFDNILVSASSGSCCCSLFFSLRTMKMLCVWSKTGLPSLKQRLTHTFTSYIRVKQTDAWLDTQLHMKTLKMAAIYTVSHLTNTYAFIMLNILHIYSTMYTYFQRLIESISHVKNDFITLSLSYFQPFWMLCIFHIVFFLSSCALLFVICIYFFLLFFKWNRKDQSWMNRNLMPEIEI